MTTTSLPPQLQANTLADFYNTFYLDPNSDICYHMPVLLEMGAKHQKVLEIGVRAGASFSALLLLSKGIVTGVDLKVYDELKHLIKLATDANRQVRFVQSDSLKYTPVQNVDVLHIDTRHDYDQLSEELARYTPHVDGFICMHDTATFWEVGETTSRGLKYAVEPWAKNSGWVMVYQTHTNNGFTVYQNPSHPHRLKYTRSRREFIGQIRGLGTSPPAHDMK